MAAVWTKVVSSSQLALLSQRSICVSAILNAKAKAQDDPIKKLFIEKLTEFKSKGNVAMTPTLRKEYDGEVERLKRVFGADKEDLSKFPTFSYDK